MKTKRVTKKNATKAYKAFNSDLTCKDFQYEVGKEYHHKGKLELCESGFHACESLADCFRFYSFNKPKPEWPRCLYGVKSSTKMQV